MSTVDASEVPSAEIAGDDASEKSVVSPIRFLIGCFGAEWTCWFVITLQTAMSYPWYVVLLGASVPSLIYAIGSYFLTSEKRVTELPNLGVIAFFTILSPLRFLIATWVYASVFYFLFGGGPGFSQDELLRLRYEPIYLVTGSLIGALRALNRPIRRVDVVDPFLNLLGKGSKKLWRKISPENTGS